VTTPRPPVVAPPQVKDTPTPSDNTTLADVLASYDRAGYSSQFGVEDNGDLHCFTCGASYGAKEAELQSLRRLEGASDPADMLAVLALRCGKCEAQGTAVVHYGPEVEPGESVLLLAAQDLRGEQGLPGASTPDEAAASDL
jgi:hypothetical protein